MVLGDGTGDSLNHWACALQPSPSPLSLQQLPAWDGTTAQSVCVLTPPSLQQLLCLVASHVATGAGDARHVTVDASGVARALLPGFGTSCRLAFEKTRTGFRWRQHAAGEPSRAGEPGKAGNEPGKAGKQQGDASGTRRAVSVPALVFPGNGASARVAGCVLWQAT